MIVRVRNIKLLIQDVIKQFDLLFDELLLPKDPKQKGQSTTGAIGLGELSNDAVISLTDLLYLPYIDKKLLTALGDFMYRLSNLHSLDDHRQPAAGPPALPNKERTIDRNRKNFLMITKQCEKIGRENLKELNELLLKTQMTFGTYDIPVNLSLQRVSSQLERSASQQSNGGQGAQADQAMRDESPMPILALHDQGSASAPKAKKMTKEQEDEIKEMLK